MYAALTIENAWMFMYRMPRSANPLSASIETMRSFSATGWRAVSARGPGTPAEADWFQRVEVATEASGSSSPKIAGKVRIADATKQQGKDETQRPALRCNRLPTVQRRPLSFPWALSSALSSSSTPTTLPLSVPGIRVSSCSISPFLAPAIVTLLTFSVRPRARS